jgi:hypothetical protein
MDRGAALTAQWAASIAPGLVAWSVLAVAGHSWSSPAAWSALAGTRLAAFLIVSAMAWTTGFVLPRGAGGSVWMGVLIVLLLRHVTLVPSSGVDESVFGVVKAAGALVICPFLLLGTHVQIGMAAVAAALCSAATLLLLTIRLASRLDVFLVERS